MILINLKNIIFLITVVATISFFYLKKVFDLEFHSGKNQFVNSSIPKKPGKNVLLVCTFDGSGGQETYSISLYKTLIENGCDTTILVTHNSSIKQKLLLQNIPFFSCFHFKISLSNIVFQPTTTLAIKKICDLKKINIIHCNDPRNIAAAKAAIKNRNIKIVYSQHTPNPIPKNKISDADGIIGVNKQIVKNIQKTITEKKTKSIYIPPFFDHAKFNNFNTTQTKREFFKQEFGVELKNAPLVCLIANLYPDVKHKNHPVLFQAIQKLIYEKKQPIQLALAGDGSGRKWLEKMVEKLGIKDSVHFLGYTTKTTELLFHSDINVLTSSKEAFGIVVLEGALMKKPTIVTKGTPVANELIQNNETGLLFENNNAGELASSIEKIINDKAFAYRLGSNLQKLVMADYSNEASFLKLEAFYDNIVSTSQESII
jgi:L-malate glycosyltransferase